MRALVVFALLSCGGSDDDAPKPGSGSAPSTSDAAVRKPGPDPADDENRKLFHCAAASGDVELIIAANVKLGLGNANGNPTDKLEAFAEGQPAWTKANMAFATEYADATKAAACARERLK